LEVVMEQKGRLKLKCWQCGEEFSLYRVLDVGEKPRLIEVCPFCNSECVVDLAPYRTEAVEIYKGVERKGQVVGEVVDLARVFPTREVGEADF
jgi:hypothetical protein